MPIRSENYNARQDINLWQQIPSTVVTEIYTQFTRVNGIVFDLEHGCFNDETLYSCIQVACLGKKRPIVRLPYLDKGRLRMCLDAGVGGVILSTVETKKQAQKFLDECLYSRKRGQGLVRQNMWNDAMIADGRNYIDNHLQIIPQIETKKGVENIDKIYDKRFTYYMVGPYDLSASYGCAGNFEAPEFQNAMSKLGQKLGEDGKLAFHLVKDITKSKVYAKADCGMLALGMDTIFLNEGMEQCIKIVSR